MSMDENRYTFSTWVGVDLAAIRDNIHHVLTQTNTSVMAIVKADGYGHGAVQVAQAAFQAGATWLGVARIGEARQLRQAGINLPILILGYSPYTGVAEMIANQVSMTVWNIDQVRKIDRIASDMGQLANLHLKVDTGMSRLGVQVDQALDVARELSSLENVQFEGIFTHFARADEADPMPTQKQGRLFVGLLEKLTSVGIRPPLIHAANSAASLIHPSTHFNLLRFGIAMYGLHPSSQCPLPNVYRPALVWKAQLSQVKTLPPGRGVSYGHIYTTRKTERIGTIPVGYGDGFRRVPGNHVLVAGKRIPVVGRVCMDQIMVQLDDVPQANEGDEVVLIGRQGGEAISAEDVAAIWGTINYEVVCAIGARVPRVYL